MGFQKRARKSTRASFAFSSCNVYNVQLINITVLQFKVKICQTTWSKGGKTEWPRAVNQAFIPDKLGLPVNVEFFGIACRPSATSGIDFGRTSRRLLLRRLTASCERSIWTFSLRKPVLTVPRIVSYCQPTLVKQKVDTSGAYTIGATSKYLLSLATLGETSQCSKKTEVCVLVHYP